ncbi:MAG: DUF1501 domain-containing protein [Rubrivivax sp.]|nr:DUF1501 domain-containing protein [Rubrivivax sp.]
MHTPTLTRRHWLKAGSAATLCGLPALSSFSAGAWAAPAADDSRFLLVFLRGAYDATSALVPAGSFYREVRPNIAIQKAVALNADWGLHPALQDSLLPLLQRGQAAFVPFAGTDISTRSHFETQDRIEMGQPDSGPRDTGSGFLNRLAQRLGSRGPGSGSVALPMAFSEQLPLSMRGRAEVANVSLNARSRAPDANQQRLVEAMYRDTALADRVQRGYAVRDDIQRDAQREAQREMTASAAYGGMSPEMLAASRGAPASGRFATEARRMARLMKDKHTLAFVDIGGWDTHVNQGADEGALATRLQELGNGLAAYAQELGPALWARSTVLVMSEFGRTLRENGNRGTDHGHGSVYWVLGGGLQSAGLHTAVRGEQVPVEARHLHQDRDLPVLQNYRDVLAGLWARQYGLATQDLDFIFPQARALDLRLL